jgi:hypothetical protein
MLSKLFVISYSLLTLLINNNDPAVKKNIVFIEGLNCFIDFNTWHYSDDQKLIGKVKTIAKESDQTGIIKATIDDIGIQFFLFENEIGTPGEFNTNINLVVQDISKYPGIKSVKDYIDLTVNQLPIAFNNVKIVDTKTRNINGYECGIIEADYDQKIGYKNFSLSLISMTILQDNKAYVFTGTMLQKYFEIKKPIIEKILYSIKK